MQIFRNINNLKIKNYAKRENKGSNGKKKRKLLKQRQ